MAAVGEQLAAKGWVLRQRTLIDAPLVKADADVRKAADGRPVTVEREAGFASRRSNRRPLTAAVIARNRALVPIRAAIERVFGTLRRSYGWTRLRCRGVVRNQAHLQLLALALNLPRADVLNA